MFVTEKLQNTNYIQLKISFLCEEYKHEFEFIKAIDQNGTCNIDNLSQIWHKFNLKNKKIIPCSDRIQININRNDMCLRLLRPPHPVWDYQDHISYYQEDETDDIKKVQFKNDNKKIWLCFNGTTTNIENEGITYAYPNKVMITYLLKEKIGDFVEEISERVRYIDENNMGIQGISESDQISIKKETNQLPNSKTAEIISLSSSNSNK